MKRCLFLTVILFCTLSNPIMGAPVPGDLVGTWGTSFISRYSSGQWSADGGKVVFNANGTGHMWLYHADSKGGTSGPPTGGLAFTYSASPNPNGTLMIDIAVGSSTQTLITVFSDSKDLILLDATRNLSMHQFGIFSRVDESGGYIANDISGKTYYGIGFELGVMSAALDYSSFSLNVQSATASTLSGQARENKNGIPDPENPFSSNYILVPDGNIIMLSPDLPESGYISKNRNMILYHQTRPTALGSYLFLKKGDKSYSTADLAGRFILAGVGGNVDNGNEIRSTTLGFMTCGDTGHCLVNQRILLNGTVKYETTTIDLSVAADGHFILSGATDFPTYGAALGNGSQAFIFNPSFLSNPADPQIFIGVRCTDCSNLVYPFPNHLPLVLRD